MMKPILSDLRFAIAFMAGPSVYAAGQATPEEAKAMAIKAADYLKAAHKAFAAFDAKNGPWHDRDLYVIVQDNKCVMVAHGTMPALIGNSMLDLKDVDGKPFNRETQAIKNHGWVEFKWQNPLTKAVEPKRQYIVHVGDYFVGVGAYVS